ncbi:hypothetical protein TWF481_005575 [Arthrobotrys musiformis]|uniref:Uncharacterized protein n=1 Tax=Arthrobotrys musiformis TaxID=47236 RepID=A0AAV9WFC0_9PEZI
MAFLTNALAAASQLDYNWYKIAISTLTVTIFISFYWACCRSPPRRPGCPLVYKAPVPPKTPTRPPNLFCLNWTFPYGPEIRRLEKFHVDLKDPGSSRRELKKYDIAGVLIMPYDGYFHGHGKLLLADDEGTDTRDLRRSDIGIAVYREDAYEAMLVLGSPLLGVLTNPGPVWEKPMSCDEFEEMARKFDEARKLELPHIYAV